VEVTGGGGGGVVVAVGTWATTRRGAFSARAQKGQQLGFLGCWRAKARARDLHVAHHFTSWRHSFLG